MMWISSSRDLLIWHVQHKGGVWDWVPWSSRISGVRLGCSSEGVVGSAQLSAVPGPSPVGPEASKGPRCLHWLQSDKMTHSFLFCSGGNSGCCCHLSVLAFPSSSFLLCNLDFFFLFFFNLKSGNIVVLVSLYTLLGISSGSKWWEGFCGK